MTLHLTSCSSLKNPESKIWNEKRAPLDFKVEGRDASNFSVVQYSPSKEYNEEGSFLVTLDGKIIYEEKTLYSTPAVDSLLNPGGIGATYLVIRRSYGDGCSIGYDVIKFKKGTFQTRNIGNCESFDKLALSYDKNYKPTLTIEFPPSRHSAEKRVKEVF